MISIRRILCPVDFSDYSRHALDWAVAFARWYGAAISVLHVHRVPLPAFGAGPLVGPEVYVAETLSDEERVDIRGAIDEFVAEDRAAGHIIEVLVEEDVNIARAIVEAARTVSADLIALGTHGRTGFDRLVLGSVTDKVLRTTVSPVLTVPPRAADAQPVDVSAIARVICPTDFSDSSATALVYAASLAEQTQARLTVMHVVELLADAADVLVPDADVYRAARFEAAQKSMSAAIPLDVRQAGTIDELLVAGKPHREIVRVASEQRAGLIVMGVHGRGVIDRMFFGSTTHHVVRQAPCPVLTIRGR